ncbi:glutamate--cysteine ligase [Aquirhabdus sp.]|uniref:glutamate--cysteine ligase n=1 Tax=Aquirhabdus sp. TaxID=2824160 RepID=UPI00396C6840
MSESMANQTTTEQSPIIPQWLKPEHLKGMKRGIEKESLRMQANGHVAQTDHPAQLGSALTHPRITTDYSEALLELITPPCDTPQAALDCLRDLHQVTAQALPEGETLWPLSMPCMLDKDEEKIRLAAYGSSNLGKFKTLYRRGLGVRYGRRMQTIAGIHYNLSFPTTLWQAWQQELAIHPVNTNPTYDAECTPASTTPLSLQDFASEKYFGLIRNFIRMTPMVIYLLGASPAVCACFLKGREHHLQQLMDGTLYLPYATALRMGKLGYQNNAQRSLGIHYNCLRAYVAGLKRAIGDVYPPFTTLGLDDAQGQPLQINDHILQLENEYYSLIRPKQIAEAGETPSAALAARGVAYVELRAVDLDPFTDVGISLATASFLEVLALYCLLSPSPLLLFGEEERIARNQARVVDQGRLAGLAVETATGEEVFSTWVAQHLSAMLPVAALLDSAHGGSDYQDSLKVMQTRLDHPEQTLSARVLAKTESKGIWRFGYELAQQYGTQFKNLPLPESVAAEYAEFAKQSRIQQNAIENSDTISFREYLERWRTVPVSDAEKIVQNA